MELNTQYDIILRTKIITSVTVSDPSGKRGVRQKIIICRTPSDRLPPTPRQGQRGVVRALALHSVILLFDR